MYAKYTINDTDFYNFNKTSFIIDVIYSSIVVTSANQKGRRKILQLGNQE